LVSQQSIVSKGRSPSTVEKGDSKGDTVFSPPIRAASSPLLVLVAAELRGEPGSLADGPCIGVVLGLLAIDPQR
jgi:hypothetical protein